MKEQLEIGDKIHRYHAGKFEHEFIIDAITKTQASSRGSRFMRKIQSGKVDKFGYSPSGTEYRVV